MLFDFNILREKTITVIYIDDVVQIRTYNFI